MTRLLVGGLAPRCLVNEAVFGLGGKALTGNGKVPNTVSAVGVQHLSGDRSDGILGPGC